MHNRTNPDRRRRRRQCQTVREGIAVLVGETLVDDDVAVVVEPVAGLGGAGVHGRDEWLAVEAVEPVVAAVSVAVAVPVGPVRILGPSGSGKTTLLRIIAGLETAGSGEVRIAEDAQRPNQPVGFVFHRYALFRHMSVIENIAFGLRVRPKDRRPSDAKIARRVNELLALVRPDGLADRFPNQLSAGQRQRVAFARALDVEPSVLLLDEPFGALDVRVRRGLRTWLRRLDQEISVTTVLVTYDQEEALVVADRVVVMNHGRIVQAEHPSDIYDHPATPFVAEFIGDVNVVELPGHSPGWVRPPLTLFDFRCRPPARIQGPSGRIAHPQATLHVLGAGYRRTKPSHTFRVVRPDNLGLGHPHLTKETP